MSGGGLISGCATAASALCPGVEVIGVEPETADDTRRSLEAGERIRIVADIEMDLRPDCHERVLAQMSRNQYLRESMQPLSYPSAGSVFKRPPGKYVGPMIQER